MADETPPEIVESPPDQTGDHVEEAVPETQIASTVADLPSDFAEPGLSDFADPAWDEIDDEDESPGIGEPEGGEDADEEEMEVPDEPHDQEEEEDDGN